ncbi:MAG: hypothetical protein IPK82_29275 [Polyangiaceae bacterium]|nr:hypothetical protein [Polyangiaceae bacterium]
MQKTIRLIPVLSALLLAACEPTPPVTPPAPTASPTGTAEAVTVPTTEAQLMLAHFKTTDGMHGFTLDRSGDPIKLQIDGSNDVVEMTKEEDRFSGELRGYWLITPDGKRPVYISKGGSLKYYTGRDEFQVTADRTAKALPAPTVKGKYEAPKPAYQATVDRLTAISVKTKLPKFKTEESANLTKIGEAIQQATADMFVHFEAGGSEAWKPSQEAVPQGFTGIAFGGVGYKTDDKWDPKGKGLAKWGGKNRGFSRYDTPKGNHMQVVKMDGYPPPLAAGTPGIVWEVDGTYAVFVTLDGGRYRVDLSTSDKGQTLAAGAGPQAKWPAPLAEALLDVPTVSSYVKAGVMPQKAIDDLLKLDEEWTTCAAKTWKGAEKKIDSGKFTVADEKEWIQKVDKACQKTVDAQEKMILELTEARSKERLALFEKAKARVASVGADK